MERVLDTNQGHQGSLCWRWDLNCCWYQAARSSEVHSKGSGDLGLLRSPLDETQTSEYGIVKSLGNIRSWRLWHLGDSDPRALQPLHAQTGYVFEQHLSHPWEQLAMLPALSKVITEYLCLLTEGDWMRVLRGSVLWEQVCLNSAFPWASMTRQVGNLEGKNWFKNINRSLLFPFIGIPLPAQSTEAYCIHQFTVLSLYNYIAVSSPSRQTRRLRFRKVNLATVTPLYTEGVISFQPVLTQNFILFWCYCPLYIAKCQNHSSW